MKKYLVIRSFNLRFYNKLKNYFKCCKLVNYLLNITFNNFVIINYCMYDKSIDLVITSLLNNITIDYLKIMCVGKLHNSKFISALYYLLFFKWFKLIKYSTYILMLNKFDFTKLFFNVLLNATMLEGVNFLFFKLSTHKKFISFIFLCDFVQKFSSDKILYKILLLLRFNSYIIWKTVSKVTVLKQKIN